MKGAISKVSPFLKGLLGVGILAWMISSGKIDLHQLGRSLAHWALMLAILALAYAQILITAWRWRLLLRAQEIPLSFNRAWGLTMIGALFNVAIPGAVSGDLIKGYYITRAMQGRKTHAATSILMDRVTGLIGLLFLGAAGVASNLSEALRTPAARSLGAATFAAFFGGIGGLYAALYAGDRLSRWSGLPGIVRTVFSALHEYRRQSSAVPVALALSIVNQAITCSCFYLALRSAGVAGLPSGQFFLIAPLGFVAISLPIAPAGVGVGQAAFYALFQVIAPGYAAAGTAAFTAFQAVFILVCLTGLFWYIPYKHVEIPAVAEGKSGAM